MAAPTYTIPPELHAHYRRVRVRDGLGCGLWGVRLFILPHTLVGLGFLIAMPLSVCWAAFGTDRVAHLMEVRRVTGSKGSVSYPATYTVADDPLTVREGHTDVSAETYERFTAAAPADRARQTIRVRGLGVAPLYYEDAIDGTRGAWGKVGFVWMFGVFWNGIVSIFGYLIYYVPWRDRRLCRLGTPVVGRVVSRRMVRNKSTTYYVRYAYRTPDGQAVEREMSTAFKNYDAAVEGTPVTVLYDPRKPARSIAYECASYRCE